MDNRERLICDNLRLVHSCCHRFTGRGIEYDDLYQAGCVGLIKAVDGFDESRGFCFSTYAFPVIMGEIKRLFRDGGSVKVSRSLKELSLKAIRQNDALSKSLGRTPTISELAASLEVSREEAAEAICASQPTVSLSYSDEGGEVKELDIGITESAEDLISDTIAIKEVMDQLEPTDRKLIFLRYFCHKTQCETAKALEMTQVQISRREKTILKNMRNLFL